MEHSTEDSCPICNRTWGLSRHHIYSKAQSKLTMTLCACCHLEYNKEAAKGKPGRFTREIWQWVIDHYCPG